LDLPPFPTRRSSDHEGTTGIQSQDLLGRKVLLDNGRALELLLTEVLDTITQALGQGELKPYAKILGEKIKLTHQVIAYLMPIAKDRKSTRLNSSHVK